MQLNCCKYVDQNILLLWKKPSTLIFVLHVDWALSDFFSHSPNITTFRIPLLPYYHSMVFITISKVFLPITILSRFFPSTHTLNYLFARFIPAVHAASTIRCSPNLTVLSGNIFWYPIVKEIQLTPILFFLQICKLHYCKHFSPPNLHYSQN